MLTFFPGFATSCFKRFMQKQRSGGIHVAAKVLLHVSAALKNTLTLGVIERGKKKGRTVVSCSSTCAIY